MLVELLLKLHLDFNEVMKHSSVVVMLIVIEDKDIIYASHKSVCKFFTLMLESLNNIKVFVTTGINIIQPLDLVGNCRNTKLLSTN